MAGGGVRTATRWAGCLALMVGGPVVLAMALVWLDHLLDLMPLAGEQEPVWKWLPLIVCWAGGLVGVHLLPVRRRLRALIAIAYTPAAYVITLLGLLGAACGFYGACP